MITTKKIMDYKIKMVNYLTRVFPEKDPSEIERKVDEIIEERNSQDENLEIGIEFFDQKSRPVKNVKMDKLEKVLDTKKPIITKYGTTYIQHKDKEALESKMLDTTGKRRKAAKKEMFKHINDEDPTLRKKFNSIQQTYKASIMNSYYGVLTAAGSIFRDLDCGESVTASGEEIIMTAIDTFEKFLSNNFHLYNPSDVITYITNIIEEEYESECGNTLSVSKEKLVDYLEDHFYDENDLFQIKLDLNDYPSVMKFIDTLTNEERSKVYYKNNLYQFLYDSELYMEIDKLLSNKEELFLDPNNPNDFQKEILENIWFFIKDWVFYNHLDFNKYAYCKKGKRRSVLVVDTDSNFLHLEPAYKFFNKNIKCVDESKEMKVASVNCITYFITKVINEAYLKFGELHNVEEKYRPLINMKNEFMLSRLLMTKNKKHYASSVLMQEGNLMENQKIDIKGLAIKKSNTNKFVSEYFTNILKDDIILTKEINYSNIINKYFKLSNIINDSLNSGETKFTIPSRANEIGSYVNPLNQMAVRGIMTWNELFPAEEITLPTNVNVCKIILEEDYDMIREKILDYVNKYNITIDEEELNLFMDRLNQTFNFSCVDPTNYKVTLQKALLKNGILDIISIPKNRNEIPVFLRPFINSEKMVFDHLNSGTIILNCINVHTPKINDNLIPTNIIKI